MAGSILFQLKDHETCKDAFALRKRTEQVIKRARGIAQDRGVRFPAHVGSGGFGNWSAHLCWTSNAMRDVLLESIHLDPHLEIRARS